MALILGVKIGDVVDVAEHWLTTSPRALPTGVVTSLDYDRMQSPTAPAPLGDLSGLDADSLVNYGGMETTVGSLLAMGVVARDPATGAFRPVGNAAAAQPAPVANPAAPVAAPAVDLSSARSTTGERITDLANLTADSLVSFAGTETTVGNLLGMGLVTRDPSTGLYRAVGAAAAAQALQPQQQEAPQATAPLDAQSEAILADATARAPETVIAAATNYISADGVMPEESIQQLAAYPKVSEVVSAACRPRNAGLRQGSRADRCTRCRHHGARRAGGSGACPRHAAHRPSRDRAAPC